MDFAELFNRKMNDFLEDLEIIGITRVQEYPLLKTSCQFLASVDKHRPPDIFYKYVVSNYERYIVEKDEAFFLQESSFPGMSDVGIVDAIKQIWTTLDNVNKEAVWKHLQVLTVLARKSSGH
jgi:hypothetical protein